MVKGKVAEEPKARLGCTVSGLQEKILQTVAAMRRAIITLVQPSEMVSW